MCNAIPEARNLSRVGLIVVLVLDPPRLRPRPRLLRSRPPQSPLPVHVHRYVFRSSGSGSGTGTGTLNQDERGTHRQTDRRDSHDTPQSNTRPNTWRSAHY